MDFPDSLTDFDGIFYGPLVRKEDCISRNGTKSPICGKYKGGRGLQPATDRYATQYTIPEVISLAVTIFTEQFELKTSNNDERNPMF